MGKAIKRPITIEYELWTGYEDCISKIEALGLLEFGYCRPSGELDIETLEGTMIVKPGDYIIKGINGEFYPCKPDIFLKTYDII